MSNESQAIVVQCAGCSAKLRMGGNARGKTVTCPKCGHQMKIDDNVQAPSQPIAAQAAATKPVDFSTRDVKTCGLDTCSCQASRCQTRGSGSQTRRSQTNGAGQCSA